MSARRLAALVAATLALAVAGPARAARLHGCTFWSDRLADASERCAEFRYRPFTEDPCTITHCTPFFCWSYPGDLLTGYLPDYFLEVTNRAATSVFDTLDMPFFLAALELADERWSSGAPPMSSLRTSEERSMAAADNSMWFGRALAVPYGPIGNTVLAAQSTAWMGQPGDNWTAGDPLPTCFKAVTEFVPETWADRLDSGDRVLSAAWAAVGAGEACAIVAPVAGLGRWLPIPDVELPAFNQCAFPLNAELQAALSLSSPNALNPARQCMGVLGGLLPRTGWTDGDSWTAAQRVAWRTASLAEDFWHVGIGVQATGGGNGGKGPDKWQIVWPKGAPSCFVPGSLGRPAGLLPYDPGHGIGYDARGATNKNTEFVFGVWRPRRQCQEPGTGSLAWAEMQAFKEYHQYTICLAANAVENWIPSAGGGSSDDGGGGGGGCAGCDSGGGE